jgi:hypothetical protein
MVNTYTLPLPSAPTTTPFQADDEGSIPFTRSTGFPLKRGISGRCAPYRGSVAIRLSGRGVGVVTTFLAIRGSILGR